MCNNNRRVVYSYTTYTSSSGGHRTVTTSGSSWTSPTVSTSTTINLSEFHSECLNAHNEYRRKHGAPDVKLNKSMCTFAQEWANRLLHSNTMQHRPNNKYGENIYMASGMTVDGKKPVESWYNEIKDYSYNNPTFSSRTGHFTQVVWRKCDEIGVGVASANGTTYVVCNYNPHGNVMGQFRENVGKPGAKAIEAPKVAAITARSETVKDPPKSSSAQKGQFNKFEIECLEAHNMYRRKHGCPPLTLDRSICNYSLEWANYLTSISRLQHRTNGKYGENLYAMYGGSVSDGGIAVKSWYDEIKDYRYGSGFSMSTGHFTQVVWKSSKKLGVGIARKGNQTYVVCNYDPPGNYQGKFTENVPRQI